MKTQIRTAALAALLSLALCLAACGAPAAPGGQSPEETPVDEAQAFFDAVSREKDHPCIHVTTRNGEPILYKEDYVPAVIDVFNCGDGYRLSAGDGQLRLGG